MRSHTDAPAENRFCAQPHRKGARTRRLLFMAYVSVGSLAYLLGAVSGAAIPAVGSSPQAPASSEVKPDANLLQLMRGMMFPESNVVFAGQLDVDSIPRAEQPATTPNLLISTFGGWQAVENSALALAESSALLTVPGRVCANGKPVPVEEAEWVRFTQGMRDTALQAYKVAQTKNTDDMLDVADAVSVACMACHNVYRSNRTGLAGRCSAAPPRAAPPG